MRLRQSMSCIACGLPLLTLAGCYSPRPYGSTGYPGYYSQPGGGMVNPQGPQLGPPTLVNPNGGVPGGPPGGGWQQPVQPGQSWDPKSSAPTFEPNSSGKVPNPDALELPRFEPPRQSPDDVPPFDERQTPLRTPDGASLERDGRGRVDASLDGNGLDFEPPIQVTPASSTRPLAQLSSAESSSSPNPFSFDRDHYRFLQGVVEYDARDKAWHVMYSAEPDGSDKFGGDVSLLDHPGLKGLHDKDVVYVEGHIDPQARDSYGKPRYRIDHMRKLLPKRA